MKCRLSIISFIFSALMVAPSSAGSADDPTPAEIAAHKECVARLEKAEEGWPPNSTRRLSEQAKVAAVSFEAWWRASVAAKAKGKDPNDLACVFGEVDRKLKQRAIEEEPIHDPHFQHVPR